MDTTTSHPEVVEPRPQTDDESDVAAVDLGSNSFHLVVARLEGNALRVLDRVREQVSLASGLTEDGAVASDAQERAVLCLERFGERLRALDPAKVRVVGTDTFRRIRDGNVFRIRAERALGHPIDIVAGAEEARLVYRGVSRTLDDDGTSRLVIDIGGGSTECIVGSGERIHRAHSFHMGCVSFSLRHFRDGKLDDASFERALLAAEVEVETIARPLRELGWSRCLGSSGTNRAIAEILHADGEPTVTEDGLKRLRQRMIKAKHTDALSLPKLRAERRAVLPGGLAILLALFRQLKIKEMTASSSALREGLLDDLVGRMRHHDVRDETLRGVAERAGADAAQAQRVEQLARTLLAQTKGADEARAALVKQRWHPERLLAWASTVHEIGLSVSYSGHHKHAGYLLRHSDLPGFSHDDRNALAYLARTQRRVFRPALLREWLGDDDAASPRVLLSLLFRLAVKCARSRSTPEALPVPCWNPPRWELRVPPGWRSAYPLLAADLERERTHLAPLGIDVVLVGDE